MDQSLLPFTLTAFVMLIVVINPVAVAPAGGAGWRRWPCGTSSTG
jgi:hypothetical protein